MNKEECIKELEYTKEKHKKTSILDSDGLNIPAMCSDILDVLKNCIEIPEGITNGDFIRILFPDNIYKIHNDEICVYLRNDGCLYFSLEWWNAPFNVEKIEARSKLAFADQDTLLSAT